MSDLLTTVVQATAPVLHRGDPQDRRDAARVVAEHMRLDVAVDSMDRPQAQSILQGLLSIVLARGELALAAELLWPRTLFCAEPESVKRIWGALNTHRQVLLMGASSMGKTYTPGVKFFLEWLRDPKFTNVVCVGPSEEHLEANLFTHVAKLHRESSLPLPGHIGERFIGLDRRDLRSCIRGIVIPLGKAKGAGRLQGNKRHPRQQAHAEFGTMSRLFILLDELENIPAGIFPDIDNVLSAVQDEDDIGFKIVGAYNPKDRSAKPAMMAEPVKGWANFDPESDYEWTSKQGWRVIRLDGQRSENVVQGRVVFPGIQTKAALDLLFKSSGGLSGPSWWTFGRGCYPPSGTSGSVIPPGFVDRQQGDPVWISPVTRYGGFDLAVTSGGDFTVKALLEYGLASGVRTAQGIVVPFVDASGRSRARSVACVRALAKLPRGETVATATAVRKDCVADGIMPARVRLDRTGVGTGVVDVLREVWSPAVTGVNYSEAATPTRIYVEQQKPGNEHFQRIDAEIWHALRHWLELGYLWFSPSAHIESGTEVYFQLTERLGERAGSRESVESKRDYQKRTGKPSPDEADSIGLGLMAVRIDTGTVLSYGSHSSSTTAEQLRRYTEGGSDAAAAQDPTAMLDTLEDF